MNDKDILFKDLTKEALSQIPDNDIAHFGWEGNGSWSFEVIADAYYASAETLYEKMRSVGNDFRTIDGHIYPLIFLYRHFIELFLKGMYIKYSGESVESIVAYFNEVGHDLDKSWKKVKPLVSSGKKHVGSTENIGAIEHCIKEMNQFDSSSMTMRYPVNKNQEAMRPKALHLDYVNLHDRMAEFHEAIHKLDYDIDNQVKIKEDDKEKIDDFLEHYNGLRSILTKYIQALKSDIERESQAEKASEGLSLSKRTLNMIKASRERAIRKMAGDDIEDISSDIYENSGDDFKILVETLFYTGRSLNSREINLSKNPAECRGEFLSSCLRYMEYDGFEFGKAVEESQTNVFGKSSESILSNIETACSIIDWVDTQHDSD